jgi:hypothetical protein
MLALFGTDELKATDKGCMIIHDVEAKFSVFFQAPRVVF